MAHLAFLVVSSAPAVAAVGALTESGAQVHWSDPHVFVQMRGDEIIDYSQVHEGVRSAAAVWSSVDGSALTITVSPGTIPGEPVPNNGVNEWGWSDDWEHPFLSETTPCVTLSRYDGNGVMLEVDTMCNAAHFTWSYDLVNGGHHPRNVHATTSAMHGLGHWVGLDHTIVYGNLMYPERSVPVNSWLTSREEAFARSVYPAGPSSRGSIRGTIEKPDGTPVPYAHVTAVNADTGDGFDTVSDSTGYYAARELTDGAYFLYVQPLTTDVLMESTAYRANPPAHLDFQATYFPGPDVAIASGSHVDGVDCTVSESGSSPDPFEPDDVPSEASQLSVGYGQFHQTSAPGDVDWIYFESVAGSCYVVKTQITGASTVTVEDRLFWSQTKLEVYKGTALVGLDDSRNDRQHDPRSWVTYCEAGGGGRIDVKIAQREPEAGGAGYSYNVSVLPVVYGPSPEPSIDELSPRTAFAFSEPLVVIHGDNFLPGSTVRVRCDGGGWQNASWSAVDGCGGGMLCGRIQAQFPPCADGDADVEVTTPAGYARTQYGGPPYGFEYLPRPFGRFGDRTWSGFGYYPGGSNGVCAGDLDDDGLVDLVRPVNDTNADIVFRNNGDATFSDVTGLWGIAPPSGLRYESCAIADVDDDGDLDVYFVQADYFCSAPGPNRLFLNRTADTGGTQTYFELEVGERGITSGENGLKTDAAFADFDGDGDLDMVMTSDSRCGAPPYDQKAVRLFRQTDAGNFEERTTQAGLGSQIRHFLSVHVADFNGDLCPDIFLNAYAGDDSRLYLNDCDGSFTDRTSQSHISTEWCKAVEVADFDNDGDADIFCGTQAAGPGGIEMQLWRNNGNAVFTDVASSAGLLTVERNVTAVTAFDFDNDGCEDLYLGASWIGWPDDDHDVVLRNDCGPGIAFTDVTDDVGVTPGESYSRDVFGVASFDMLGDGAWDVYASGWTSALPEPRFDGDYLWRNLLNRDDEGGYEVANHFIDVALEGANEPGRRDLSNRRGIGAKVTVIPDYPGVTEPTDAQCLADPLPTGTLSYTKEMRGGSRSQDPPVLHFGLGNLGVTSDVDCIVVRWPSGHETAYRDLAVNSKVRLREMPGGLRVVKAIPNVGPNTQSTEVRLVGFHFEREGDDDPTVTFGGRPALSVEFVSDTELRAWTPLWQSPGSVDVVVTNPDGEYAVLQAGFSYTGTGSSGFVRVKDPYPELVTTSPDVPDDPVAVAHCCNDDLRGGVQADGVTRLILEVEVAGGGSVHFVLDDDHDPANPPPPTGHTGTIEPLDHSNASGGIVVPVVPLPDGRWMAHAVYRAPQDFLRSPADEPLAWRNLVIRATYFADGGGSVTFPDRTVAIRRVGAIYVHGMWGSPNSFGWSITGDSRWYNHRADYRETNARSFAENRDMPPRVVLEARTALNVQGIAATRFFVFAHSMGGVLFKIYMAGQGAAYLRNDNFMTGDVYALVPIDSPMRGSHLAPVARDLIRLPGIGPVIERIGRTRGLELGQGCMWSLDPDSPETLGIGTAFGRFAVGVGYGGGEMRDLGIQLLEGSHLKSLETLFRFGNRGFEDYLLHCDDGDDFVVCAGSQTGGVAAQYVRQFHYQGPAERAIHFDSVCHEAGPDAWAGDLLNTPTGDTAVWATQLPATSAMPPLAHPPGTAGPGWDAGDRPEHGALEPRRAGRRVVAPQRESMVDDGYVLTLGKEGGEIVLHWTGQPTRLLKSFGDATLAGALCLAVSAGAYVDAGEADSPADDLVFYRVSDSPCSPIGGTAPAIASIAPQSGSTVGGYPVTLQGANFDAGSTISVDGVPVPATVQPNGQIATYSAPSHGVGVAAVDVSSAGAASSGTTFDYEAPGNPPGSIAITEPAPGITVAGGTQLTVRAEAAGAFTISKAVASSEVFIEDADTDPGAGFQVSVTVPDDYLGTLTLRVDAQDDRGNVVSADPVQIHVTQPPGVQLLRIYGPKLTLLSMQKERPLRIEGIFSDGVRRSLSHVPGLIYEIDPPDLPQFPYSGTAIATVDTDGTVTAKTRGRTICHVTYDSHTTDVLIEVSEIAPTLNMRLQQGVPEIVWLYITPQGPDVTYDIVRGSLGVLRATGGDFAAAITQCVKDDLPSVTATEIDFAAGVPPPGDGFFYLLRDSRLNNYDTLPHWPSSRQIGERNGEIASSGAACGP